MESNADNSNDQQQPISDEQLQKNQVKRQIFSNPSKNFGGPGSSSNQLALEQVIGLTATNRQALAFNQVSGELAYPAGSVVVNYSIQQNRQTRFFFSPNKRTITCLCFSSDNRYLVAGEGVCKNPEILFWELNVSVQAPTQQLTPTSYNQQQHQATTSLQLKGHKFGVKILQFSPNNKYLVSIGDGYDRGLFVWDWRNDSDGTKLVTAGQQHLKFWYFDASGDIIQTKAKDKDNQYIMECKNSNLGQKFLDKNFVDVSFSHDSTYLLALSIDGMLCIINDKRILEKWMDLKVSKALSMQTNQNFIFCGCGDGIIRVFKQKTLEHLTTLPRPPTLNNYNIEKGITKLKPPKEGELYADCIAIMYDNNKNKLCSLYSDKTMFIWDLRKIENIHVKRSFLNHSGKINDIQILHNQSSYDVTFFATSSDDKTICIWHILDEEDKEASADISKMLGIRRNVYSKYLSRILYITDYVEHFRYREKESGAIDGVVGVCARAANEEVDKKQEQNEMEKLHIKCIRCSVDGQYIVSGDTYGTLYIFSLKSFELLKKLEAHDQEVNCIDFTPINDTQIDLFASGSRDRYIHVFNVREDFSLIATLDDHCSSIIQLKFFYTKSSKQMYLVSCEADKTIIFRQYIPVEAQTAETIHTLSGAKQFTLISREIDKNCKFFCQETNYENESVFFGQEKKISNYKVATGKPLAKQMETKEEDRQTGKIINLDNYKLTLDPSGTYLAASNNDKIVRIRDVNTGQIIARASPGDHTTGIAFTMNNKNLITTTNEGCIFIWKLPQEIKNNIEKKKKQLGQMAKRIQELFKEKQLMQSKEWLINSFWIEDELQQYIKSKESSVLNQNTPHNIKPQDLINFDNLPIWAQSNKDKKLANYQKSEDEDFNNKEIPANIHNPEVINRFVGDSIDLVNEGYSQQPASNNNNEFEKKIFEIKKNEEKDENMQGNPMDAIQVENYSKTVKQDYDSVPGGGGGVGVGEDRILDFQEDPFQKQLQQFEQEQELISKKDRSSMSSMFRSKKEQINKDSNLGGGGGAGNRVENSDDAAQQQQGINQPQLPPQKQSNFKISFKFINEQINLDSLFKKTTLPTKESQDAIQQREQNKIDLEGIQQQLQEVSKNIQLVENHKKLQNDSLRIPELKFCDNRKFVQQQLPEELTDELDKNKVDEDDDYEKEFTKLTCPVPQQIAQDSDSVQQHPQQQVKQTSQIQIDNYFSHSQAIRGEQEGAGEPTILKINKNLLVKKSKESIINKSTKFAEDKQSQQQKQFLEIVPDEPKNPPVSNQVAADQLDILQFDDDFEFSQDNYISTNQVQQESKVPKNNSFIQQILDNQIQEETNSDKVQGQGLINDNIIMYPPSLNNSPPQQQLEQQHASELQSNAVSKDNNQIIQTSCFQDQQIAGSDNKKSRNHFNDEQSFQKIVPQQSVKKQQQGPDPSDFQFVANPLFRQESNNEDINNFQPQIQQEEDEIILLEPNNFLSETNNNQVGNAPTTQPIQTHQQQSNKSKNVQLTPHSAKSGAQQQPSPNITNLSHYAQSEFEESRVLQDNNNSDNSGKKLVDHIQKTSEASFANISSSLDTLINTANDIHKIKNLSKKEQIQNQINYQLFLMNNKLQNLQQVLNNSNNTLQYSRQTNATSSTSFYQNPSIINDLVINASKDILENYSKLLIDTIKSNLNKK